MPYLDHRESEIIAAIKLNHEESIENRLRTQTQQLQMKGLSEQTKISLRALADVRSLTNHYLDTIAHSDSNSAEETIANESTVSTYFTGIAKAILPERLSSAIFDNPFWSTQTMIFSSLSTSYFSAALGSMIGTILYESFSKNFTAAQVDEQKEFKEMLAKESALSQLITKECERISVEIIKIFHFREMLLLGKITQNPMEPDARTSFIDQAHLEKEDPETINQTIEIYFAQELTRTFNEGFKSLYTIQEYEIKKESKSEVKKWFHHLFDSHQKRLAFTQEIQLKFMQLSIDYMTGQMNEPGLLATHYIISSLVFGLIIGFVLALAFAFLLSPAFVATIAIVGGILASISAYFMLDGIDYLHFLRYPDNRQHIQESINLVNNEYLILEKMTKEAKITSKEDIQQTKSFRSVNTRIINILEQRYVARGSVSGWLREYASRYRHSHAIEIDLAKEYSKLMNESKVQTKELVASINNNQLSTLEQWISTTKYYLKREDNQEIIKESELIPKIKEQVLEILSQLTYIPPILLDFYCASIAEGGLGGNCSDFNQLRRLLPETGEGIENPYHALCTAADNLYKQFEPKYLKNPIFYGDPEYRNMLGIARGDDLNTTLTLETIDQYLQNSLSFLLSLNQSIAPGPNIDPLQQPAQVRPEFTLYRMLLLKQLANVCNPANKTVNSEVKIRIKQFVKEFFKIEPDIIFDDLNNQKFLLNKKVQQNKIFKNKDGYEFIDVELDNIIQAVGLDLAYNSVSFKLIEVLNQFINTFAMQQNVKPQLFAHDYAETELNPQCTDEYVNRIKEYCQQTSAFLTAYKHNPALTTTNILKCYRYNLSQQVYRTQLLIIKNIQELSKGPLNSHFKDTSHLLDAYMSLKGFASANCYALIKSSPLKKLEKIIVDKKENGEAIQAWASDLNRYDLALAIDDLPNQFHKPYAILRPHKKDQFFKAGVQGDQSAASTLTASVH